MTGLAVLGAMALYFAHRLLGQRLYLAEELARWEQRKR